MIKEDRWGAGFTPWAPADRRCEVTFDITFEPIDRGRPLVTKSLTCTLYTGHAGPHGEIYADAIRMNSIGSMQQVINQPKPKGLFPGDPEVLEGRGGGSATFVDCPRCSVAVLVCECHDPVVDHCGIEFDLQDDGDVRLRDLTLAAN